MTIYFLQFLSKINRIVKSYPDLSGYSSFIIQEIGGKDATNFPYRDGIDTKEFYNFNSEKMPDYAIIVDNEDIVTSRWYIQETKYTRKGQWEVKFRRDVLADFREQVINATALIEKATVSDNDPAIYNQEKASFNLIKKSEELLIDKSNSAWLVGYLSSDDSANKKYIGTTVNQIAKTISGISTWEYFKYVSNDFYGYAQNITYNVKYHGYSSNFNDYSGIGLSRYWLAQVAFNSFGAAQTDSKNPVMGHIKLMPGDFAFNQDQLLHTVDVNTCEVKQRGSSPWTWNSTEVYNSVISKLGNYKNLDSIFIEQNDKLHSPDEEGSFKGLDGSIIFDSVNNKTYRVKIVTKVLSKLERYSPSKNSALYNRIKSLRESTGKINFNVLNNVNNDIYAKYYVNTYRIELVQVENNSLYTDFTSSRRILNDAPYSLFAIPFNVINYKEGANTYQVDKEASLGIARTISMDLMSSGSLYDLQLLPYCPRQDLIDVDFIDLRTAVEHEDYEIIFDDDDNYRSFILFAKESSFSFDIDRQIEITEKKVENQCDSWRICSPNYNGVFQFNPAKNNGVDYFNVDCTYRPFNPYIHVNPNFKELYGNDYDDARGLICSGDFSMPACTEKWLEYEAQNKNYQNSFDRSIQHMEIEQKYQRIGAITGAVGGTGQGAIGGGIIGGWIGAIAGGVASAAGGVADVILGEQLRSEQLRYAKDQFEMNLENIKALPNSLAKVSAFNKNNKIFPFLEYYTCTDIEKEAFRNLIKYDGMTVNRIGKIIDFLQDDDLQYVKAKLIRCDIHDDMHIVDVIASEMEKGAYYDTRND